MSSTKRAKTTGIDNRYDRLDDAIRTTALTYGHPPGTLAWKEVPGNQ
jgi:hypothetical protein